jgi:predicted transcriptional regulator
VKETLAQVNEKIRSAMSDRIIWQRDIGDLLDLPQAAVSHRLSGRSRWHLDEIIQVVDLLDVPIEWLTDGTSTDAVPAGGRSPGKRR